MTPDTLLNRINFTSVQQDQQQPVNQTKDLDRRLHQYRSKLLSATNRLAPNRQVEDQPKQHLSSTSNDNSSSSSNEKISSRRQTTLHNYGRNTESQQIDQPEVAPEVESDTADAPIKNTLQEDQQHLSSLASTETDVAREPAIENVESSFVLDQTEDEFNFATDSAFNVLSTFQQLNFQQQPEIAPDTTEKPAQVPQALTKLFSRFDQLPISAINSPVTELTPATSSTLDEAPAIPSSLARLISGGLPAATPIINPPPLQSPVTPEETLDSTQLLPEIPVDILSAAQIQILDQEDEVTPEITTSLDTSAVIPEDVIPVEFFQPAPTIPVPPTNSTNSNSAIPTTSPSGLSNIQVDTEKQAVEANLEPVVSDDVNTITTTSSSSKSEEASTTQPVTQSSKNTAQALGLSVPEALSSTINVNVDQNAKVDTDTPIEPSLFSNSPQDTKATFTTTLVDAQPRDQQIKDIINQIKHAFSQANDGPQSMRVRLNPPELGMVQIDIIRTEGGIIARVQAESPQAHQLINEGIQQLKDSLALQGQVVQSIQIDLTPDLSEDRDPTERQPQQQQHSGQDDAEEQSHQPPPEEKPQPELRREYITEMDLEI